jgi:uncharacterized membrane protein YjjP (DUF1212 family)
LRSSEPSGPGADDLDTVLKAAALLHENGQSTEMTVIAVDRLNRGLGVRSTLIPSWASLLLVGDGSGAPARVAAATPAAINMRRVSAAMRTIDRAEDGPLDRDVVNRELAAAATESVSNTATFTVACATGAAALAVVFGATDVSAVLLAAASAALGGVIRRALGRFGIGLLVQGFAAATVAGLVAAAATHLNLAAAGLIAVCPAMVLVPGPHVLNGALDLLALRLTLGIARLGYATLILAAIAAGLIIGLRLGGQTLSVSGTNAHVPFYADVLAAGVAAASYPVYFSMPYRMIGWPVVAGMAAHAVHWWAMTAGHQSLATAAFLACLLVGIALVPGVYMFRMLAGLVELPGTASPQLLAATVSDGAVAALVVTGMAVGLVVPMHIRDAMVAARGRGAATKL